MILIQDKQKATANIGFCASVAGRFKHRQQFAIQLQFQPGR